VAPGLRGRVGTGRPGLLSVVVVVHDGELRRARDVAAAPVSVAFGAASVTRPSSSRALTRWAPGSTSGTARAGGSGSEGWSTAAAWRCMVPSLEASTSRTRSSARASAAAFSAGSCARAPWPASPAPRPCSSPCQPTPTRPRSPPPPSPTPSRSSSYRPASSHLLSLSRSLCSFLVLLLSPTCARASEIGPFLFDRIRCRRRVRYMLFYIRNVYMHVSVFEARVAIRCRSRVLYSFTNMNALEDEQNIWLAFPRNRGCVDRQKPQPVSNSTKHQFPYFLSFYFRLTVHII
jgi:hypothetical protein